MLGFSSALACPLALQRLPRLAQQLAPERRLAEQRQGGVGLFEVGFFKFLSNADLVLQLGLLQRELFIAIWLR